MNVIYDILDNILDYLNINDFHLLLMTCKNTYTYTYYSRYNHVLLMKICNYFNSFDNIKLNKILLEHPQHLIEISKSTFNLYKKFKNHKNTYLQEFLYELNIQQCTNSNLILYDSIARNIYFKTKHVFPYEDTERIWEKLRREIRYDELTSMLLDAHSYKYIKLILKYIYIPKKVLTLVIKTKLQNTLPAKFEKSLKLLFNYLFLNHLLTKDILTDFIIDCIKYDKKCIILFILNSIVYGSINKIELCQYINCQYILTYILNNNKIDCLLIVKNYFNKTPIMITKNHIKNIMIKKNYILLDLVIEFFLTNVINMSLYFNEIYFYWNKYVPIHLLRHFNEQNKNKLSLKCLLY